MQYLKETSVATSASDGEVRPSERTLIIRVKRFSDSNHSALEKEPFTVVSRANAKCRVPKRIHTLKLSLRKIVFFLTVFINRR